MAFARIQTPSIRVITVRRILSHHAGENQIMQTRIPPHCHCDACGEPIYFGQPSVSLNRNLERCDCTDNADTNEITVMHSLEVLTLCLVCGERLPVSDVTQLLRAELKRRLAYRN